MDPKRKYNNNAKQMNGNNHMMFPVVLQEHYVNTFSRYTDNIAKLPTRRTRQDAM